MISWWAVGEFAVALGAAVVVVLALAEWVFNRRDPSTIICWNCLEEYDRAATNCPVCEVVKFPPYRCPCGRLHEAGTRCPDRSAAS